MVADYEWIMVGELAVENHYDKEKPLLLKNHSCKKPHGVLSSLEELSSLGI